MRRFHGGGVLFGNWFHIALACAFLTACSDAVSKRILQHNDEWITGTAVLGISALILAPIVLPLGLKPLTGDLVILLAITVPLEIFGYYLFLSAIRMGQLSLTLPLLAFTPVLTIGTSAILLGERISLVGGCGIALVAVGAYVLHGDLMKHEPAAPIRALFSSAGARRMLAVACIWGLTSALGKKGILMYGALPFGFVLLCADVAVFASIVVLRIRLGKARISLEKGMTAFFLLGGLLKAGAEITHFVSLSMAPVAYMISVKRLSLVVGVALGWLVFGERNIGYRLVGASVMVCGAFLIYQ